LTKLIHFFYQLVFIGSVLMGSPSFYFVCVKFMNNVVTFVTFEVFLLGICFEVRYHGEINKLIFKIHIMVCCVIMNCF